MTLLTILITTCNRAAFLKPTLETLGRINVPRGYEVDLLVVDNASVDATAEVVRSCQLPNMRVSYLYESRRGQSNARNTGMAAARGDILIWTDDDVRPPQDWIAGMCHAIVSGEADATAGKIRMAPHLERSWMTRTHYDRLSDTRFLPTDLQVLIGANMAFHRRILEKVPAFDPQLGPGALGFMDDTLFSFQTQQAGFRIAAMPLTAVEHHFDPARLCYASWLRQGLTAGRSLAYVAHHWEHFTLPFARLQWMGWKMALATFRAKYKPRPETEEGCDRREIRMVQNAEFYRAFLAAQGEKRNYARKGLVKS